VLHQKYQVPHVIITSLRLTRDNHTVSSRAPTRPGSRTGTDTRTPPECHPLNAATSQPCTGETSHPSKQNQATRTLDDVENLTIIGSTATSDHKPRLFRIDTPQLPLFFSGTGDMFAALIIPRLVEAVQAASSADFALHTTRSWRSPDHVRAEALPLAKACQKVLASMQAVLTKTADACYETMEAYDDRVGRVGSSQGEEEEEESKKKRHLALMCASEVQVVRHVRDLVDPQELGRFEPRAVGDV